MSKTKENIIKRIALFICNLVCLLVMCYMVYHLYEKQEVISLNSFLLLMGGLYII